MRKTNKRPSSGKHYVLVGIGGIKCRCCTHFYPSVTKKYWNRIYRRTFKIEEE